MQINSFNCDGLDHHQFVTPLAVRTSHYFQTKEPSEWYPIYRDSDGRIKIDLSCISNNLKNSKDIIYIFTNILTGQSLIGKSSNDLRTRMQGYLFEFNRKNSETFPKSELKKLFLRQVKENPAIFQVGILHVALPGENLESLEIAFIEAKKLQQALYNTIGGGGGGTSHSAGDRTPRLYALPQTHFTPEKYYQVRRDEEGRVVVELTPGIKTKMVEAQKEEAAFLYQFTSQAPEDPRGFAFKRRTDGKDADWQAPRGRPCYVGETGDFVRRVQEHARAATHYDPERATGVFHRALAQSPERYRVGLLPVSLAKTIPPAELKDFHVVAGIGEAERLAIRLKQTLFSEGGLNCNGGGGGSVPSERRALGKRNVNASEVPATAAAAACASTVKRLFSEEEAPFFDPDKTPPCSPRK